MISAIDRGMSDFARLYIQYGINIHAQDKSGRTALMMASTRGDLGMVILLFEKGADINNKDVFGQNSFFMAKFNGHDDVADFLEGKGANTSSWQKYLAEIKLMEEKGFIPNQETAEKISPSELLSLNMFLKKLGIFDIKSWIPDKKFSSPEKTWTVYKSALQKQDFDTAFKCMVPNLADKHKKMYKTLGYEKMEGYAKDMRPIEKITGDEKRAKYRIKKEEIINGKAFDITYYINFVDIYGEWKIESF